MKATLKATGMNRTLAVEYFAVKKGENVTFHLMNAEPQPISYRVKLPGKAEKVEGSITTPTVDVGEAGAQAMTARPDAAGTTISGLLPAYSLLSVVVPGIVEKK